MNGELLPDDKARISVFDHGLVVGDGVFETIKVAGGAPFAMTRHLERLRRSAVGLGLPDPDIGPIREGALAVIAASGGPPLARLRVTVTGGKSPLGSERGNAPVTAIVAMAEQPKPAPTVDVVAVPWPRNERGALSGLKTTSCGLAGVTRALVIEWADAEEQDLPLDALAGAEEAFLSGTTRDVQPIRNVDGIALPAAPGPVTRKAAEIFALRSAESPDP